MFLLFIIINQVSLPMEQVSFDEAGKIYVITEKQEKVFHLFPEISNFYEATLFKISNENYILRIKTKVTGRFYTTEGTITPENLQQIRITLSLHKELFHNREGYGLFALSNFELALGEWGGLGSVALNDARYYLIIASTGYFIPLFVMRNQEITYGEVTMSWLMPKHGIILTSCLLEIFAPYDISPQFATFVLLSGSVVGDIFGYNWAKDRKISAGKAWMYHHMMWSGEYYGGALGYIFSPLDNTDMLSKITSAGIALGEIGGFLYWNSHKSDEYSFGTALSYDVYSFLTLYTGANITSFFPNTEDELVMKSHIGFNLLFNALFNYIGMEHFANKNFSGMSGLLHIGGSTAGALLAGGIISFYDIYSPRVITTGVLAGAWLGYGLTYMITSKSAHNNSTTGFNIEFTPEAPLFGYLTHQRKSMPLLRIKF